MSRDASDPRKTRRSFLRDLAAVGGAAAVAGSAGAQTTTVPVVDAKPDRPQGYRLTPHIRKYYDKARS
jgi:hypothetical protein